jgi:hypothetical protein
MTAVSIITSLVLAILTGFYVWLTHRLVRQATIANQQTQDAFRRQFQLATYPLLTCSVQRDADNRTKIVLRNSGSLPATDTDILALAGYLPDPLDASAFVQKFIESDSPYKKRLFDGEEGMYSVYDRIVYSEVPQSKQVVVYLQVPVPPDVVYVLLQFRDITGVNYAKVYWFFRHVDEHPDGSRFRLGSIDPQTIMITPRVNFNEHLELFTEDGSDVSTITGKDFVSAWQASIPCGYLKGSYLGVEDRGTWTDI